NITRTRKPWTTEEKSRLEELFETLGPKWSEIATHFEGRSPSNIQQRYRALFGIEVIGPWTKEEIDCLRELVVDEETTDWAYVQRKLPMPRPLLHIKQTWQHSINPKIVHGKWSEEETERLVGLVRMLGDKNWVSVSKHMTTRTPRQCLERWKWQVNTKKKGQFTKEEDELLLKVVKIHGDQDFLLIQKEMKSERSARHISQHYHFYLNPKVDRSPWTFEE
ncbi:hypothetical protein BDF14DRAFT_1709383, partial [Spinellus fusiger]